MTGKELHQYLETKIEGFKNKDLYYDEDNIYQVYPDLIKGQIEKGFVLVNNTEGLRAFYYNIENKKGDLSS
ncbi:MAG: hypothetical protein ACYSTS_00865 [Planctomycetota bacterium]